MYRTYRKRRSDRCFTAQFAGGGAIYRYALVRSHLLCRPLIGRMREQSLSNCSLSISSSCDCCLDTRPPSSDHLLNSCYKFHTYISVVYTSQMIVILFFRIERRNATCSFCTSCCRTVSYRVECRVHSYIYVCAWKESLGSHFKVFIRDFAHSGYCVPSIVV